MSIQMKRISLIDVWLDERRDVVAVVVVVVVAAVAVVDGGGVDVVVANVAGGRLVGWMAGWIVG